MRHQKLKFGKPNLAMKTAFAIAALAGMTSAQAATVQFNPSGTGYADALSVTSAISTHGSGFAMAQINPSNPTNFLFSETGAYQLTQADGVSPLGSHDVTLTYSVMGTINPLNGALTFSTGTFQLYSDATFNFGTASSSPSIVYGANDGTLIGSFAITSGSGSANGNAQMLGSAIAGSVLSGYFFSSTGEDLSQTGNLQFAVNIGNVIDLNPSSTNVSELACKAAGFPGPGCNGTAYSNTPYYNMVSDGGSVTLSTMAAAVPEPDSAALFFAGLGLLGLVARRTRKTTPAA